MNKIIYARSKQIELSESMNSIKGLLGALVFALGGAS